MIAKQQEEIFRREEMKKAKSGIMKSRGEGGVRLGGRGDRGSQCEERLALAPARLRTRARAYKPENVCHRPISGGGV